MSFAAASNSASLPGCTLSFAIRLIDIAGLLEESDSTTVVSHMRAVFQGESISFIAERGRLTPIASDRSGENIAMLGFDLTDEQLELKALAHKFAEQEIIPRAREYDEKEIFPVDVCEKAFAAGLMNFGCAGISNAVGANDLATLPILIAGNDEQKRTYLGQLIKKLTFCAFAITE